MIRRVSGGRPFVLTSVVRAMVESGALRPGDRGWLIDPGSLATLTASGGPATLVLDRLGRLPDETLSFLSAGAVLGRHASVAEAAGLASIDLAHSDAIVEEARRAGLIWPTESRDRFSFVHDKVREGALGRLSDTRRRALHLAAAELVEQQRPGDLFDLAYHFDEGGAPERALPQALEAAALARARQALESAEMMYRIAVPRDPRRGRLDESARRRRPRRGADAPRLVRGSRPMARRGSPARTRRSGSSGDRREARGARLQAWRRPHRGRGDPGGASHDRPPGAEEPRGRATPPRLGGSRASGALPPATRLRRPQVHRGRAHRPVGVEVLRSARVRVVVRAREARRRSGRISAP